MRKRALGRQVATGAVRMAELGYHAVQLWLNDADYELLKKLAKADRRPMTTYIVKAAIDQAHKDLLNRGSIEPIYNPPPSKKPEKKRAGGKGADHG